MHDADIKKFACNSVNYTTSAAGRKQCSQPAQSYTPKGSAQNTSHSTKCAVRGNLYKTWPQVVTHQAKSTSGGIHSALHTATNAHCDCAIIAAIH
jgi:hypothetical protein